MLVICITPLVILRHQCAWGSASLFCANNLRAAVGNTVTATINEATIATAMVMAKSANNCPDTASKKAIGKKIATVVMVEAIKAPHTCVAPFNAAFSGCSPFSRKRTIFSKTTMAASSTIPTAKAKPAIEIILSVLPVINITIKVITNEIGIANATINVALNLRKNHQSTIMASAMPINKLLRTKSIERLM